jgi:hypothetical protein
MCGLVWFKFVELWGFCCVEGLIGGMVDCFGCWGGRVLGVRGFV